MCACYVRWVLEGQETITQEAFSEHLLNYGSGQLHGNNFCFIEPQDTTWAIKYSFVFCELISNRIPSPNFLSSVTVQRSHKTFDSIHNSIYQQCFKAWYLFTGGGGQRSKLFNVLVCFFGKLVSILLLLLSGERNTRYRERTDIFPSATSLPLESTPMKSDKKITFL